jgi:hypothetical protein
MAVLIVRPQIAWQSNGVSTTKSPREQTGSPLPVRCRISCGNAERQRLSFRPHQVPGATELAQQFIPWRDLAVMRNSVEQLAAKHEQMTQEHHDPEGRC